MAQVAGNELVIDRADGVWIYDEAGKRYLDACGSLWYANAGHGREEVIEQIAEQLRRLDAYSTFGELANRPALELADRLAELAPVDDGRVFLGSGGGDAIDTAADRPRFLRPPWRTATHAPDQPCARLPWYPRLRYEHRRDRGKRFGLGASPSAHVGGRS